MRPKSASVLCLILCLITLCISCNAHIAVYYKTNWDTVYIHDSIDGGKTWNSVPGDELGTSSNPSYSGWKYSIINSNDLIFDMTNGHDWDNNNGQNYHITDKGAYTLQNGQVAPASKISDCQHGTLETPNLCVCDPGYYGYNCARKGKNCGPHGRDVNGECVCDANYGTCKGVDGICMTDFLNDNSNCGGCGKKCTKGPKVALCQCGSGECHITACLKNYKMCPNDNTQCYPQDYSCGLPGCETYQVPNPAGDLTKDDIHTPSSKFGDYGWQAPRPGDADYDERYGGLSAVMAYGSIQYTDPSMTSANLVIVTLQKHTDDKLVFCFDGKCSSNPQKKYDTSHRDIVNVVVKSTKTGLKVTLNPIRFVWQATPMKQRPDNYEGGKKGAVVELFGWKYTDVARECEFMGKAGYLAVKVQTMGHLLDFHANYGGQFNPWFFNYQPTGYDFESRYGSYSEFIDMVDTCRSHGVGIINDFIINHSTGSGNDMYYHRNDNGGHCDVWGPKTSSQNLFRKNGPLPWWISSGFAYKATPRTGNPLINENPYAALPPSSYHAVYGGSISWNDPLILNAMALSGLTDIDTSDDYTQRRIASYIVEFISAGGQGGRVDAAKHIRPQDLAGIFKYVRKFLGGHIPESMVMYLEVLTGGERDMLIGNPNSPYSFTYGLRKYLLANGFSNEEAKNIMIWDASYPLQPFCDSNYPTAIENDDFDESASTGSTSRDLQDKGVVLTKVGPSAINQHREFEKRLFTSPYGCDNARLKLVLSSYWWYQGIRSVPDGYSDCKMCTGTAQDCKECVGVPYFPAYKADSCGYDAGDGYTRVHRDIQIINAMRQWMGLSDISHADLGLNC
ncbi:hypothetical protein PCE1_001568 [Barthelona sp. PCE]